MAKHKYYATIVKVYVLSQDGYPTSDTRLDELHELTQAGPLVLKKVTTDTLQITPKAMAKQLHAAGSEPSFFNLDDEGNEVPFDSSHDD